MKKLSKIVSMALALTILLSVSAVAAEVKDTQLADNSKATVWGIQGAGGATVTFDATNPEIIHVTYSDVSLSRQYLIMMVTATEGKDGEGNPTGDFTMSDPGDTTIKYIDQVEAVDGAIEFEVYPASLTDSIIVIYGLMPGGAKSLKAAIVEAKYVLGDVTGDGVIDAVDALQVLRFAAKDITFTDNQKLAADVTNDQCYDAVDALQILRFCAGAIPSF